MPFLSLCIPTYNRASLLTQSLWAVLSQIGPSSSPDVEVLVLDNASPDGTPGVVARAQAEFPHVSLRSIRHARNIGADANFLEATRCACGEFVYLLSDDDVLLPGAVERLLGLIREHPDLDAFALNVREFIDNPAEDQDKGFFKYSSDTIVTGRDSSLVALGTHITFMSCLAFRRANIEGRDYADRFSTLLGQAYMFLDVLAPSRGMYVTSECYLAKRADNNEGFDFFRVFVTDFHTLMQHARQTGYSQKSVDETLIRNLDYIYYLVVQFKSRGLIGKIRPNYATGLIRLLRVYGPNRIVLLTILPRMLVPRILFLPLQRFYIQNKARLRVLP